MKNLKDKAEDAQKLAILYPETFEAPTNEELSSIKPGMFVKICVGSERFWIKVDSVNDKEIQGKIDNQLVYSDETDLYYEDEVSFTRNNVYQIFSE
jgi:hypothetical protein